MINYTFVPMVSTKTYFKSVISHWFFNEKIKGNYSFIANQGISIGVDVDGFKFLYTGSDIVGKFGGNCIQMSSGW